MDINGTGHRPDVTAVATAARPTPTPRRTYFSEVNAQNRSFTALSNVLEAEHDTVKTAIGNVR